MGPCGAENCDCEFTILALLTRVKETERAMLNYLKGTHSWEDQVRETMRLVSVCLKDAEQLTRSAGATLP